MKPTSILCRAGLLLGILLSFCSVVVFGNPSLDSPTILRSGKECLDTEQGYELSWNITDEVITFEVRARTLGYIGFGLSPAGRMNGSDIFLAGVFANGTKYSSDRHATGHNPVEDAVSNYELKDASETTDGTFIKFERLLNTNDDDDYTIADEATNVIWAIGETDDLVKHKVRNVTVINFFNETSPKECPAPPPPECTGPDCSGKEFLHAANIFAVSIVSIVSILAKLYIEN